MDIIKLKYLKFLALLNSVNLVAEIIYPIYLYTQNIETNSD